MSLSETKIQEPPQFSSILMELTMQYAELTDSNMFLLIETDTVRRFAGKQHLKDLYQKGDLKPCGKDAEIVVDPSLTQMCEVSKEDKMQTGEEDIGARPRRHIGELPSERRVRLKNEKKTYYKFVNMSSSVEGSFGTFLMEALMKYSCMTDVNIFFLIETNRSRRFTGKRHLCDQYLQGSLKPTGFEMEMDLDTKVKVVTEQNRGRPEEEEKERERERQRQQNREREADAAKVREATPAEIGVSEEPPTKRKHQGELPSERRARAIKEGKLAVKPGSAKSPSSSDSAVDGRKHVGELPSERRERMKREREGEDSFGPPAGEGPGYIFGPSNYNYYNPADMKDYAEYTSAYGWNGAGTGEYSGYSQGYGTSASYGYGSYGATVSMGGEKSSASNGDYSAISTGGARGDPKSSVGLKSNYAASWKAGGTIQAGQAQPQQQYGW